MARHLGVALPQLASAPAGERLQLAPDGVRLSRCRRRDLLAPRAAGDQRSGRGAGQAVPPSPAPAPGPPLSWAFASGMLLIGVAAMQLARQWLAAQAAPAGAPRRPPPNGGLSDVEAGQLSAMGPVLLAAETGAGVDETALLSADQLEELEGQLRLLIASMESQLADLQASLAAPQGEARRRLADAEAALAAEPLSGDPAAEEERAAALRWARFEAVAPHAAEPDRRTYRSLLFNLGTQRALLLQVERRRAVLAEQAALLQKKASLERRMADVWGGLAATEAATAAAAAHASSAGAAPAQPAAAELRLVAAGAMLAHPRKRDTGGEDAYFVSDAGLGAAGVADGVGGWAASGIDPKLYPRALMAECAASVLRHEDPLAALREAHGAAHAPGSATVVLAALSQGGVLRVASLGDCGARLLRAGAVIFASDVQEHRFNQPFQMSSPRFLPNSLPDDAHAYRLAVQPGDAVVLGSDGLWDNLWDEELVDLAAAALGGLPADSSRRELAAAAAALAGELVRAASAHSSDPGYRSPYAVERQRRAPEQLGLLQRLAGPLGGKPDDITAVVGLVW